MLVLIVFEVYNMLATSEHTIEQVNEQVFIGVATKKALEPEIGERVDVLAYWGLFTPGHVPKVAIPG